jgi:excisionase family DNA binding protein
MDKQPVPAFETYGHTPSRPQARVAIAPSDQEGPNESDAKPQSPGLDRNVSEIEAQDLDDGPVHLIPTKFARLSGREPEDVPATSQTVAHLVGRLRNLEVAVRSLIRDQEYLRGLLPGRMPGGPAERTLLGDHPQDRQERPPGRPEGGRSLAHPDTISTVEAGGRGRSPYLDATEAAAYLGITLKSLYGIVERGHLEPLRGPRRRYRFTSVMLDEYLARRGGR